MILNQIFELAEQTLFKYKGFPAIIQSHYSWNEYVGETQKGIKLFDRGFVVHFIYNDGQDKSVVLRTNHPDTSLIKMPDYEI
jgi:hypothetical protein